MQDLKNIIESLLFVADETLTVDKLREVIEAAEPKEIRSALEELANDYEKRGGGFYLSHVAGGFQIRSRPDYHEHIKRLLQPSPQRLSRAALETLAIIAYRQPIIRADVEHIRGVDCGAMLRQLLERKLIRVLGRKEIPGRPLIYATTRSFLELFELKDLSDLPTPAEIEKISAANHEQAEQKAAPAPREQDDETTENQPAESADAIHDEGSDPSDINMPAPCEPTATIICDKRSADIASENDPANASDKNSVVESQTEDEPRHPQYEHRVMGSPVDENGEKIA